MPRHFGVIATISLALSHSATPLDSAAQSHEDWSYNLSVYEVNVRQYTAAGTFDAFSTHLDRLQDLGAGILWFMPIHPIGVQNRLGSLGSYYSVRDYRDVNPEFGDLGDFRDVVEAAHDRGMYVIIDWVANHTSWDNGLTVDHPEWYVTNSSGEFIPPPNTNWSDVIELDFTEPGLRAYMIEAMRFWVEDVGVDGFRFDAVDFVPDDFWSAATDSLLSTRSDLLLLAEDDSENRYDQGFHMTYGWGLYGFGHGVLKRIADGEATATNFGGYVATEKIRYPEDYRMYFTANHDENSWEGTTAELFGDAAEVFAVLTATFHGLPLIYSGQEAGLDKRLAFFDKDQITWRDHPNAALYRALLALKRENKALWNGRHGALLQRVLSTNNTDVFAFIREREEHRVFVGLNLSDVEQNVTLSGAQFVGEYENVMSGESVVLEEGASLVLPPWGYVVYEKRDVDTAVDEEGGRTGASFGPAYPNPSEGTVRLDVGTNAPAEVAGRVFDVLGRQVGRVDMGSLPPGQHTVTFALSGLPAGVYAWRVRAGSEIADGTFVLAR